jgi:hypothetical protein
VYFDVTPGPEQFQRAILRPQCRIGVPLPQNVLEQGHVSFPQPALEVFTGIFVDEVSRGIFVGIYQGHTMPIRTRLGLVDPVDKGLFVPDDEKIAIKHGEDPDRGHMGVKNDTTGRGVVGTGTCTTRRWSMDQAPELDALSSYNSMMFIENGGPRRT